MVKPGVEEQAPKQVENPNAEALPDFPPGFSTINWSEG